MKINFKKLNPKAEIPKRQRVGDVGYDLVAVSEKCKLEPTGPYVEYDTGIAVEIPEGYVGLIFPRSGITTTTTLMLGNSVGVLDPNFRGSIKLKFRDVSDFGRKYNVGDRIAQLLVMPALTIDFNEVDELSGTDRGDQGFGSSGR